MTRASVTQVRFTSILSIVKPYRELVVSIKTVVCDTMSRQMKRWFNIWGPWTNMLTWVTMSKVLCSGVFIYIKLLLRLFLKGTRIKNFDNVKNQITIIALV